MTPHSSSSHPRSVAFFLLIAAVVTSSPLHASGTKMAMLRMQVTDNHGRSSNVIAGIHEFATNGLDDALNEYELPPLPPTGIFDARFVSPGGAVVLGEGALNDLRPWRNATQPYTDTWKLSYQGGRDAQHVTIRMPASYPTHIRSVKIDGKAVAPGDSVVTLIGQGVATIVITFDESDVTFTITPLTLTFPLSDRDSIPPPAKSVQVTPSLSGAYWRAWSDDGWIAVDPPSGNGDASLSIGLANLNFIGGRTTGTVYVTNTGADDAVSITVNVDMVTGVDHAAPPADAAIDACYPNPYNAAAGGMMRILLTVRASTAIHAVVEDALGRSVRTLTRETAPQTGVRSIAWDGTDDSRLPLPPALYFVRIAAGERLLVQRVLLVR